jgi:hypothetical protein
VSRTLAFALGATVTAVAACVTVLALAAYAPVAGVGPWPDLLGLSVMLTGAFGGHLAMYAVGLHQLAKTPARWPYIEQVRL